MTSMCIFGALKKRPLALSQEPDRSTPLTATSDWCEAQHTLHVNKKSICRYWNCVDETRTTSMIEEVHVHSGEPVIVLFLWENMANVLLDDARR